MDDPLDAFAVHGACGFWGLLATGLFCTDANVEYAAYPNAGTCKACSTFEQFGVQFLGGLVIFVWTAATSGALFFTLKMTMGLRVSEEEEDVGLDKSEHGIFSTEDKYGPSMFDVETSNQPVKVLTISNTEP